MSLSNVYQAERQSNSLFNLTLDTAEPVDAIEFCPFKPYQHVAAIATYLLNKETQQKSGGIHGYSVSILDTTIHAAQIPNVLNDAILDIKWAPAPVLGWFQQPLSPILAGSGNRTGISLIRLTNSAPVDADPQFSFQDLTEDRSRFFKTEKDHLCLSVDWEKVVTTSSPRLVTSMSSGFLSVASVSLISPDKASLTPEYFWRGHEYDAWTAMFANSGTHQNVIVSGGDDCILKIWDLRMIESVRAAESEGEDEEELYWGRETLQQPSLLNRNEHTVGVTCMCQDEWNDQQFFTGSFDGIIRLWDYRNISQPISRTTARDGVWRLKCLKSEDEETTQTTRRILAACTHSGTASIFREVGDVLEEEFVHEGHKSMTYGADYCRDQSLNLSAVSDILRDPVQLPPQRPRPKTQISEEERQMNSYQDHLRETRELKRQQMFAEQYQQNEIDRQEREVRKEIKTHKFNQHIANLEAERLSFVRDTARTVAVALNDHASYQHMLNKDWNSRVYNPIQNQILSAFEEDENLEDTEQNVSYSESLHAHRDVAPMRSSQEPNFVFSQRNIRYKPPSNGHDPIFAKGVDIQEEYSVFPLKNPVECEPLENRGSRTRPHPNQSPRSSQGRNVALPPLKLSQIEPLRSSYAIPTTDRASNSQRMRHSFTGRSSKESSLTPKRTPRPKRPFYTTRDIERRSSPNKATILTAPAINGIDVDRINSIRDSYHFRTSQQLEAKQSRIHQAIGGRTLSANRRKKMNEGPVEINFLSKQAPVINEFYDRPPKPRPVNPVQESHIVFDFI
ncbi:putative Diphthine methyltransferase [Blattamonas nauphoetae]|uniref:methylated diphthine methylhydrolase n=1 Tax=Blattamonas nauphoetae TaxID=2049346 RepID=A0ABQ9XXA0_9EUKA|nr:putative Diphthine methyltransferase [Blattamonas nauphoetae]